jgi:hypothetical protein
MMKELTPKIILCRRRYDDVIRSLYPINARYLRYESSNCGPHVRDPLRYVCVV